MKKVIQNEYIFATKHESSMGAMAMDMSFMAGQLRAVQPI